MQAGQCGNQMGTNFWEVVRDEHGNAGDGEYCCDNDAHFDRASIFYHEASGGKYGAGHQILVRIRDIFKTLRLVCMATPRETKATPRTSTARTTGV
jgi:hypothetical protein